MSQNRSSSLDMFEQQEIDGRRPARVVVSGETGQEWLQYTIHSKNPEFGLVDLSTMR